MSTLTRLVDAMERRRLLARRREPDDARAIAVCVTAAGRRLTGRILPIAERYEKVALEGFLPRDVTALKAALRRLYANMDGLEQTPRSRSRNETSRR
jgi:DNA-binding MarR family transcriptional regulator